MADVILTRRRYVLAEAEDSYGIWHRTAEGEPLERFPLTAEGFDAAEDRLRELVRLDRQKRGLTAMVLWYIVLFGGALWIIAGLAVTVLSIAPFLDAPAFQFAYSADYWAYRLAVGGLIMLGALLLVRVERWARGSAGPTTLRSFMRLRDQPEPSSGPFEAILRWALVLGLAAWILSVVGTEVLFNRPEPQFFVPGEPVTPEVSSGYVASRLVQELAFRVWIAALVLLIVRWGGRWISPSG
jgi:hypothetical protein